MSVASIRPEKKSASAIAHIEALERRWMLSVSAAATVVPLVSDQMAIGSNPADSDLVNPWGVSFGTGGANGTPFWVSDNGIGKATLYNSVGQKQGLVVTIPAPPSAGTGATAAPTGQVFNTDSTGFNVTDGTHTAPAAFVFVTEDGTVSGWNFKVGAPPPPPVGPPAPSTKAFLTVDQSRDNSVFKGSALGMVGSATNLYVTDFHHARVDAFNDHWQPANITGDFTDPRIPNGYAPFNIVNIGGNLIVTFAKQNSLLHDDVAGPGHGFVDEFDTNGNLIMRFKHTGALNSPWGVALVPNSPNWGPLQGEFLVGQFGSGHIAIYKPDGHFDGLLDGADGKPVTIDGLWTLTFGGGKANNGAADQLFFTAGPDGETHGLFGTINITLQDHGQGDGNGGDDGGADDLLRRLLKE